MESYIVNVIDLDEEKEYDVKHATLTLKKGEGVQFGDIYIVGRRSQARIYVEYPAHTEWSRLSRKEILDLGLAPSSDDADAGDELDD